WFVVQRPWRIGHLGNRLLSSQPRGLWKANLVSGTKLPVISPQHRRVPQRFLPLYRGSNSLFIRYPKSRPRIAQLDAVEVHRGLKNPGCAFIGWGVHLPENGKDIELIICQNSL